MDGGIDYALSRIIFKNIEQEVKIILKDLGIKTKFGRYYLPIGSCVIMDKGHKALAVAPTMLFP